MALLKANLLASSFRNSSKITSLCNTRLLSSSSKPLVVFSKDGGMVLCWHPQQSFPYEHTKPLPRNEPEIREGDSELKAQYLLEEQHKFRPDGPTQQELMKIFHTTRHVFDPKPALRYRKKNPPKDRDGI